MPKDLTIISFSYDNDVKRIATQMANRIGDATGYNVKVREGHVAAPKSIFLNINVNEDVPKEGYKLKVTTTGVTITATEPAGLFYGVQTLYQLLPPAIFSKTEKIISQWSMPVVTITTTHNTGPAPFWLAWRNARCGAALVYQATGKGFYR